MLKYETASPVKTLQHALDNISDVEVVTLTINDSYGESHRSVPISRQAAEILLQDQISDMSNKTYQKLCLTIAPMYVGLGQQKVGAGSWSTHLQITI